MELSHKRFDEVFDLQLGRTPARGVDKYWGGTNTWVSIADMGQSKYISYSKECITDTALAETNIPVVPKDVVIMSFKLSIGKVAITKQELYTNEAIMAFIPKPGTAILNDYLYYYLQGYKWNNSNNVVLGFTLNKKAISSSIIAYPSLPEQRRIVGILDQEFAKIDALKANAERSLQAAKDLFQASLKKELEPKDGWKKKKLNEICEITAELIDPTLPEYLNKIHIGGANIVAETGVLIDLKTSREENLISGKFPFDETMVLYSKIRPYLKKVCCPDFQGICSADIYPLKPSQDVDRTFLYYILLSQDFTDYAILGSARAGMPKVNRPYMFAYSCSIPEYEEQRKVANRLDAVREQTYELQDNYQKTLALCDDLKQALLRKAFNGEL